MQGVPATFSVKNGKTKMAGTTTIAAVLHCTLVLDL